MSEPAVWVLIFWLGGAHGGPVKIAEYPTEPACLAAVPRVRAELLRVGWVTTLVSTDYICIRK